MPEVVHLDDPFEPEVEILDKRPDRVLVLYLHGMWANGQAALDFQPTDGRFHEIEVLVRPVSYALVGPATVVFRPDHPRRVPLVADRISRTADAHPHDQLCILCHSFGTKVFSRLPNETKEAFTWVFLAGAVCHMNDDAHLQPCGEVINECGLKDLVPILATAVRPDQYGTTGVTGFSNHPVTDRYHRYNHTEATKPQHFRDWLLPILTTGRIRQTANRPNKLHLWGPTIMRFAMGGLCVVLILAALTLVS